MSDGFNISYGKGKDVQNISDKDIKSGISKNDITDKKMQSIFDMIDNGDGTLDNNEINKIKNVIQFAAAIDDKKDHISNKEAKNIMNILGISGISVKDLFNFFTTLKVTSKELEQKELEQKELSRNSNENLEQIRFDSGNVYARKLSDDGTEYLLNPKNNYSYVGSRSTLATFDSNVQIFQEKAGIYTREQYSNDDNTIIFFKNGKQIGGRNEQGNLYINRSNNDGSFDEVDINTGKVLTHLEPPQPYAAEDKEFFDKLQQVGGPDIDFYKFVDTYGH